MADAGRSIFNKRATEKLRSPDDLEKYVRVTSPSVWVALAGVLAVVLGLLAWGVFGSVSTSVSTNGVYVKDHMVCFLTTEDASKVHPDDLAYVDGAMGRVTSVTKVPLSREEAYEELGSDYLVDALMTDEWCYFVVIDGVAPEVQGIPIPVSITTKRVAPITLVLG